MLDPNVPRLPKKYRFTKLIEGMREGKTFIRIAKECGVSEKTIDRDFKEWKDNGGFDKWLVTEFMILHDEEVSKEGRSDAYRVVADLLKKRLKEQSEVAVKGGLIVDLAWLDENALQSPTNPTLDNTNSTSLKQDSACCHAAEDGEKQRAAQTKQSDKPSYAA